MTQLLPENVQPVLCETLPKSVPSLTSWKAGQPLPSKDRTSISRSGTHEACATRLPGWSNLHRRLSAPGHPERDRRIDWEAAKTRVLSVLKQRAERGEPGLSNAEIRQITHMNRNQVVRLMRELMKENPQIIKTGERRWTRYAYAM